MEVEEFILGPWSTAHSRPHQRPGILGSSWHLIGIFVAFNEICLNCHVIRNSRTLLTGMRNVRFHLLREKLLRLQTIQECKFQVFAQTLHFVRSGEATWPPRGTSGKAKPNSATYMSCLPMHFYILCLLLC